MFMLSSYYSVMYIYLAILQIMITNHKFYAIARALEC